MIRLALLLALVVPVAGQTPTGQNPKGQTPTGSATPAPEAPAPIGLFERIVVVGASVSGGYGLGPELKATVHLGDVLECALPADVGEIVDLGDTYLFQDPHDRAPELVEKTLAAEPTLIVAIDFLFWFSYSSWRPKGPRSTELEAGLALLDRLPGPLVVGDLPDMTPALGGKGPLGTPMLTPRMIPSPAQLASLNERIREWAAERGDVTVLPMADMVASMLAGERVAIRENVWEAGALDRLLQEDLLHPNSEGTIALALMVLDRVVAARPELTDAAIEWDAREVRERLLERTREEREKRLERERRWAERRAAREKRKRDGDGESP